MCWLVASLRSLFTNWASGHLVLTNWNQDGERGNPERLIVANRGKTRRVCAENCTVSFLPICQQTFNLLPTSCELGGEEHFCCVIVSSRNPGPSQIYLCTKSKVVWEEDGATLLKGKLCKMWGGGCSSYAWNWAHCLRERKTKDFVCFPVLFHFSLPEVFMLISTVPAIQRAPKCF